MFYFFNKKRYCSGRCLELLSALVVSAGVPRFQCNSMAVVCFVNYLAIFKINFMVIRPSMIRDI